jgi:uncharacterized cupin superfamily protein
MTAPAAVAGEATKGAKPSPHRLDAEKIAGVGLEADEPWPAEDVISGRSQPRGSVLYRGDQLVIEVYEDAPSKLRIAEPFTYDEFVHIVSGKLILTDAQGRAQEYLAGESLVVPKGFTGTWEMQGNYRELIAIERKAYDAAYPPE